MTLLDPFDKAFTEAFHTSEGVLMVGFFSLTPTYLGAYKKYLQAIRHTIEKATKLQSFPKIAIGAQWHYISERMFSLAEKNQQPPMPLITKSFVTAMFKSLVPLNTVFSELSFLIIF